MIDEKKLFATLAKWENESKETAGLKEPALLRKLMAEVKSMAVNEEIKARIAREDADGWIPVTERLPDPFRDVLAQWETRERFTNDKHANFDVLWIDEKGNWESGMGVPNGKVVAWMPLPEPYRGGNEE